MSVIEMSALPSDAPVNGPAPVRGPGEEGKVSPARSCIFAAPIAAVVLWVYGSDLVELAGQWWRNPDYIHGFLVIPFSGYLAWHRRSMAASWDVRGSRWGYVLVAMAVLIQCASAYMSDPIFKPLSIVPCLAGVALVLGGWGALRWLWPSFVFLVFMVPLPSFVASLGNLLLQRIATLSSTFVLQTLGVPAVAFGNVIALSHAELGVEEACSGLRSIMLFFAVSFGAAFLIPGIPERIAVVLSAIPAAILANIIRIAATGLLYEHASAELAEVVFHDVFGFFMLPLAACFTWLVFELTRRLWVAAEDDQPLPLFP